MIYTFKKLRPLFFPVDWANSVVSWIAGVRSPRGTIIVKNTLSPNESGSVQLDVDIEVVSGKVLEVLRKRSQAKAEAEKTE